MNVLIGQVNNQTRWLTTERTTFQTSPWMFQKPTTQVTGNLKTAMSSSTLSGIKLPTTSTNVSSKCQECWGSSQILIIFSSVIMILLVINSLTCLKYIRIRNNRRQDTISIHYDEIPSKPSTPTERELGRCEEIKLVFVHKNKESVLQMKPVIHSNDTSLGESSQSEVRASHITEIAGQSDATMDVLRSPLSNPTATDGYMLPLRSSQTHKDTENTDDYLTVFN